jgi:hypothetical protein
MSDTRRTVIGRRMPCAGLEVGVPPSHLTGKGSHLLEGPCRPHSNSGRQGGRSKRIAWPRHVFQAIKQCPPRSASALLTKGTGHYET